MKQQIVIKVYLNCDKCRSTTLTTAAKASGVVSVALEGKLEEDANLVVIGERVDAAGLVRSLRKKIGNGSLESVGQVVEEQEEDSDDES